MIDIISTPKENEVFQNAAPIPVHVKSTKGAGYYFTLSITIDNELYDTLTVSKKNEFDGEIDLQNVVENVFKAEFSEVTTTEITQYNNLLKKVVVTINEIENTTNSLETSLDLPAFYLVNSNNIEDKIFNKIQSLSVYDSVIRVPVDGVLQIPFFANERTTVKIIKGSTNVFFEAIEDAFGVYNFKVNLAGYNLVLTDVVNIVINSVSGHIILKLQLIDYTGYSSKLLAIQNNYNAWEYFYAFGRATTQTDLKHEVLKIDDYTNKKYNVIQQDHWKIDTGYYYSAYAKAIKYILAAYVVYYYENEKWINVEIRNKKTVPVPERENIFQTLFELYKNERVVLENAFQFSSPEAALSFIKTGTEGDTITITKAEYLAHYSGVPTAINFPLDVPNVTITIFEDGVSSPINFSTDYDWETFEKVTFSGDGFGNPWKEISYRFNSAEGYSNTAKTSINLVDDNPNNQPPVISVLSETTAFIDAISKTITATITDPEDEGYSVIWSQESGDQVTLSNINSDSLKISNWNAVGEYEFKVTATDVRGASSFKIVKLTIMDYKVEIGISESAIRIYNGKLNEQVAVGFKIENSYLFQQNRGGNSATKSNKINNVTIFEGDVFHSFSSGTSTPNFTIDLKYHTELLTFNADGEIIIPIAKTISSTDPENKLMLISNVGVEILATSEGVSLGNLTCVAFKIVNLADFDTNNA